MAKLLPDALADIADFARRTAGGYPERFAQTLDYAFTRHMHILNAAQLRELVGGGSQLTAQTQIDQLRQTVSQRLRWALPIEGAPEAVTSAATELLGRLWQLAREAADQAYAKERDEQALALTQAVAARDLAQQQYRALQDDMRRERAAVEQAQTSKQQEFDAVRQDLEQRLHTAQQSVEQLTQANAGMSVELTQLRAEQEAARRAAQQLQQELQAQRDLTEHAIRDLTEKAVREASQARDRQTLDHRQELRRQAEGFERDRAAVGAQLVAANTALEKARDEILELQKAQVRQAQEHAQALARASASMLQDQQRMQQEVMNGLASLKERMGREPEPKAPDASFEEAAPTAATGAGEGAEGPGRAAAAARGRSGKHPGKKT